MIKSDLRALASGVAALIAARCVLCRLDALASPSLITARLLSLRELMLKDHRLLLFAVPDMFQLANDL